MTLQTFTLSKNMKGKEGIWLLLIVPCEHNPSSRNKGRVPKIKQTLTKVNKWIWIYFFFTFQSLHCADFPW